MKKNRWLIGAAAIAVMTPVVAVTAGRILDGGDSSIDLKVSVSAVGGLPGTAGDAVLSLEPVGGGLIRADLAGAVEDTIVVRDAGSWAIPVGIETADPTAVELTITWCEIDETAECVGETHDFESLEIPIEPQPMPATALEAPKEPAAPIEARIDRDHGGVVRDELQFWLERGPETADTMDDVAEKLGGTVSAFDGELGYGQLRLSEQADTVEALDALIQQAESIPGVSGAFRTMPSYPTELPEEWQHLPPVESTSDVVVRDDSGNRHYKGPLMSAEWAQQWHWEAIGQPAAWRRSTGDGVAVGIVDSMFDTTHPDLDSHTQPIRTADDHPTSVILGHGTLVAGLACARSNTSPSHAVGAAPDCDLVLVEAGRQQEIFYFERGMTVAAREGAQVINLSFGKNCSGVPSGMSKSDTFRHSPYEDALRQGNSISLELHGREPLWVAAAGNCLVPWGVGWGGIEMPNLLVVASVDSEASTTGRVWLNSTSAFGDGVDISAPGGLALFEGDFAVRTGDCSGRAYRVNVASSGLLPLKSDDNPWGWTPECGELGIVYASGTSLAAPMVSGVAAQLLEVNSAMSPADVKHCLVSTASTRVEQTPIHALQLQYTVVREGKHVPDDQGVQLAREYLSQVDSFPPVVNPSAAIDCALGWRSMGLDGVRISLPDVDREDSVANTVPGLREVSYHEDVVVTVSALENGAGNLADGAEFQRFTTVDDYLTYRRNEGLPLPESDAPDWGRVNGLQTYHIEGLDENEERWWVEVPADRADGLEGVVEIRVAGNTEGKIDRDHLERSIWIEPRALDPAMFEELIEPEESGPCSTEVDASASLIELQLVHEDVSCAEAVEVFDEWTRRLEQGVGTSDEGAHLAFDGWSCEAALTTPQGTCSQHENDRWFGYLQIPEELDVGPIELLCGQQAIIVRLNESGPYAPFAYVNIDGGPTLGFAPDQIGASTVTFVHDEIQPTYEFHGIHQFGYGSFGYWLSSGDDSVECV